LLLNYQNGKIPFSSNRLKKNNKGLRQSSKAGNKYLHWAQGGFNLKFGLSDKSWEDTYGKWIPDYLASRARTAMWMDTNTNKVYLAVTPSATATGFRRLILDSLGILDGSTTTRYAGIMLDGGGSTQLQCLSNAGALVKHSENGSPRNIRTAVVLIDNS
jgi:hypothetical protein